MDTASVARPAAVTAQAASVRAENLVSVNRVKTELPKAATVTGVDETSAARFDVSNEARDQAKREQALREAVRRNLTIDPKTRQVVFRAVDSKTGVVVNQIPSEAILKLRAYYRDMADRSTDTPRTSDVSASLGVPRVERTA